MADELNAEEQRAIDRAKIMNAELMSKVGAKPGEPIGPMALLRRDGNGIPVEGTIDVMVPKGFLYRPDHHAVVEFKAGPQPIPEHLADHWWIKNHGVVRYETTQIEAKPAFAPGATLVAKADDAAATDKDAKDADSSSNGADATTSGKSKKGSN